jgi:hypothetical protein
MGAQIQRARQYQLFMISYSCTAVSSSSITAVGIPGLLACSFSSLSLSLATLVYCLLLFESFHLKMCIIFTHQNHFAHKKIKKMCTVRYMYTFAHSFPGGEGYGPVHGDG